MTVSRFYEMNAKPGMAAEMEASLYALADAVRKIDGCEGVEMLRDTGNEGRFLFNEKWASIEYHKGASGQLPKDVFGPLMAAMDGPPVGAYFDYLKVI
ncbi:putative quinol monooxygenase [Sphingomonas montanisoli]|uniref:Antibiotic biosynthesis monooxygenase n=1 Tax=Sphingomonas montanisoli TaxID=2606412 RepID=A0A5D9CBA6_9SPHN|nr:antibiotic biosynthesis monooxygenase family protein [Sphingomonas montanisoli]TZG27401.1 antibiotic biosynthesis monooxygenase [Sphingomonas montanisoli]